MTITTQQTDQWAADVDYWRKKYADLGLQYDLLQQRIKELEADAKRLDWMERQDWNTLDFLRPIDAPHDSECGVWSEDAGQYTFGKTVREAVDRAMSEAALAKAVEISQEYKLP